MKKKIVLLLVLLLCVALLLGCGTETATTYTGTVQSIEHKTVGGWGGYSYLLIEFSNGVEVRAKDRGQIIKPGDEVTLSHDYISLWRVVGIQPKGKGASSGEE